jgi:hypothetical protein
VIVRARRRALALGAVPLFACAHVNPTLAPARVMPEGRVVLDTGGAYAAPVSEPVLAPAREATTRVAMSSTVAPSDREDLARAVAVFGATGVGAASYLAVRAGLSGRVELQGALLGARTVRLGVRRAFVFERDEKWALALGLQARAGLDRVSYGAVIDRAEVRGSEVLGGDLTAQIGRTSSELYDLWLGARLGYTRGAARVAHPAFEGDGVLATEAHRAELGLHLGMRVGFGRIAALAELEAQCAGFWASAVGTDVRASGVALALVPAGALAFTF